MADVQPGTGADQRDDEVVEAELLDDDLDDEPVTEVSVETLVTDLERVTIARDEFRDAYQRAAADFDNFRKQSQRRLEDEVARSSGALVERLLPVLDACDGALAHGATEVEPIATALLTTLEKEGLVRVDTDRRGVRSDGRRCRRARARWRRRPHRVGGHATWVHLARSRPATSDGEGHRLMDIDARGSSHAEQDDRPAVELKD